MDFVIYKNYRFFSNMRIFSFATLQIQMISYYPHLEYCIEVWNPGYRGDIIKMEKVQNRMTRLLREGRFLTPEQRNERLQITSHEVRRSRGDMINMYKYINAGKIFTLRNDSRTRGNDKTVRMPQYNSDPKRHSFAYRGINEWNTLPNIIVNAETLNIFKTRIDSFLSSEFLYQ